VFCICRALLILGDPQKAAASNIQFITPSVQIHQHKLTVQE